MPASVEDVLKELVHLCERRGLEYAVMGGLAVRVHGIPRPTYDVDLAIAMDAEQLQVFFDDLEATGYTIAQPFRVGWRDEVGGMPLVKLKTYLAEGQTVDVDIFLSDTPFLQAVMARRVALVFDDQRILFVTPEDLILLKLLANRPRDLSDIADILFVQGDLDTAHMRPWAQALDISPRLEAVLSPQ